MPEETPFTVEQDMDRAAIARYLRTVAGRLESGDEFTLSAGRVSVTLAAPGRIEFEVEVERETSKSGISSEIAIEFELEWDEDVLVSGGLSIDRPTGLEGTSSPSAGVSTRSQTLRLRGALTGVALLGHTLSHGFLLGAVQPVLLAPAVQDDLATREAV